MDIIIHVVSLGCAKNLVDTEVMCGGFVTQGMYLAEDPSDANVMLINTCSFIRDARQEAVEAIREAIQWKRRARRQRRVIAVAGCLVQRNLPQCMADFPEVDLFLGLDDVPHAAERIRAIFESYVNHSNANTYDKTEGSETPASFGPLPLPTYLYDHTTPRLTVTPEAFAYVKIAEGCNHFCAYCAIPAIRGRQRSRTVDSILQECKNLLANGVKEINFIAQDSSSYGEDLPDKPSLATLLAACDDLPGEFWLRVLYTHPKHITTELLERLAHGKHLVPYLDMPLQHINSDILHAMRRGMDGPATRALLKDIRSRYPELTIRTTFLVGFPGETTAQFQELMDFTKEFGFDRLGAFAFSREEGTPAALLTEGIVAEKEAARRRDSLLAAQKSISLKHNTALLGKTLPVLLTERISRGLWLARGQGDAPDVDQTLRVHANGVQKPMFAHVKVTAAAPYDLEAVIC